MASCGGRSPNQSTKCRSHLFVSELHPPFPVSTLKIDQSFIKRIGGEQNGEIVRAVVALARNLGMQVVAEGIETVTQLDQLRALNCEQGQGYYFSRPVDVASATALIQQDERGERLGVPGRGTECEAPSEMIDENTNLPGALASSVYGELVLLNAKTH